VSADLLPLRDSVAIVGAGVAGLMTALSSRRGPSSFSVRRRSALRARRRGRKAASPPQWLTTTIR
jgi:glycine/D-amino acid oxidase-like deaminating enzyme